MGNGFHVVKHESCGIFTILHEPQGGWRDGEDEARFFRSLQQHPAMLDALRAVVHECDRCFGVFDAATDVCSPAHMAIRAVLRTIDPEEPPIESSRETEGDLAQAVNADREPHQEPESPAPWDENADRRLPGRAMGGAS